MRLSIPEVESNVDEPMENEVNLNELTASKLKIIAKEKGITGYSNMTKQQLIDAINEAP